MVRLGLRRKPAGDKVEEKTDEKRKSQVPTGPRLLVLVPTIAGVGSYRLHSFDDSAAAAKFITSSPHPVTRTSAYAFWALPLKPRSSEPDSGDEAIVLVRTEAGSDSVSVVSFVDIESAQSFARFEVKRGLNPSLVMIYWAIHATISETEGGYQFAPPIAPTITRGDWETAIAVVAPPAPSSVDDIRRKQAEEKKRIQAELREIKRRQVEVEELKKRQIEAEAQRKHLVQAEHKKRQQVEEARKLHAEAEELKSLKAEAEALKKQQAETETRLRQEAAERKRQAEAEEKRLRELEAAEREQQIQSGAQEQALLAAELEEIKRQQAEVKEQTRIEADERKRQARTMEDNRLRAAAEDQLRGEVQSAEKSRLKAELEEMKRQQAQEKEIARLAAEQRLAEAAAHERSIRAAKTDNPRQFEADELEKARLKAELEAMFRDKAQAPEQVSNGSAHLDRTFALPADRSSDTPDATLEQPEGPTPIDQLLAEMPKVADVVSRVVADSMKPDVIIPPEFAKDDTLDGEAALEGEPALAAHMKKTLRRTRWQKKETDFDGFKSPPGRF